jgi:uncharacterized membrane protein
MLYSILRSEVPKPSASHFRPTSAKNQNANKRTRLVVGIDCIQSKGIGILFGLMLVGEGEFLEYQRRPQSWMKHQSSPKSI